MAAGAYGTRLEWLKQTVGTDGFGQRVYTYPAQGYLWAAVEDLAASRGTAKGSDVQQLTATVRLRNYPAVAAGDQLRDAGRGETWTVSTARRGDNELVCEVGQ